MKLLSQILILFLVASSANASRAPEYNKHLFCISLQDGEAVWRSKEENFRFVVFEAYPKGLRVQAHTKDGEHIEFRNADTGAVIQPFDSRDHVFPDDDELVAVSAVNNFSSIRDERKEIELENRWFSFGNGFQRWYNVGKNQIYFFSRHDPENHGVQLKWVLKLPEGSYSEVKNIKDTIIYPQRIRDGKVWFCYLWGIDAGQEKPKWKIDLSETHDPYEFEIYGKKKSSYGFAYQVIGEDIVVEYRGEVFLYDYQTGKLKCSWDYRKQLGDFGAEGLGTQNGCVITGNSNYLVLNKGVLLICIDIEKRECLWVCNTGKDSTVEPMVFNNNVYGYAGSKFKMCEKLNKVAQVDTKMKTPVEIERDKKRNKNPNKSLHSIAGSARSE